MDDFGQFVRIFCIILMTVFLIHGFYFNPLGIQFASFFAIMYAIFEIRDIRQRLEVKKK